MDNSWVNEAEESAAVGGIDWDKDLICGSGTGNGYPIRAKSCANGIGLRHKPPADVVGRPGEPDRVAGNCETKLRWSDRNWWEKPVCGNDFFGLALNWRRLWRTDAVCHPRARH